MRLSSKTAILSLALLTPHAVNATNGAWLIGFGAVSRSMGGTGVADNRGAMASAFNPATMSDSGNRFDIGADLFIPPRKITHESQVLGYTDERSNHDLFLVPSMGLTYGWDDKTTVGFALIGAGLKTEYNQTANSDSCNLVNSGALAPQFTQCPPTVFNAFGTDAAPEAGVELMQMQILPSVAYKLNDQHSIGATLVMGVQFFRAEGFEDFGGLGFTTADDAFTSGSWDESIGAGFRLGWLGKYMEDRVTIGANYSSRVYMTKFEEYENLFAEQGSFDIPENFTVGISYAFKPTLTFAFDVQRIFWSDVKSIGNPGPNAADPSNLLPLCPPGTNQSSCLLGGDKGLGFGWHDQTVYKFGMDWAINEKWNARAGWNYGKSPIQPDQILFNMMAPATPEHHLTLGVGYKLNDTFVVDGSLIYAFSNPINGQTPFGPGGAIVTGTNASIDMVQLSIGGALGIRF